MGGTLGTLHGVVGRDYPCEVVVNVTPVIIWGDGETNLESISLQCSRQFTGL